MGGVYGVGVGGNERGVERRGNANSNRVKARFHLVLVSFEKDFLSQLILTMAVVRAGVRFTWFFSCGLRCYAAFATSPLPALARRARYPTINLFSSCASSSTERFAASLVTPSMMVCLSSGVIWGFPRAFIM